jgi:ribosomal protein L11 methylase PrmA
VLPPGLLVEGRPAALAAAWPALCPLQPVSWAEAGLVCAPRSAPELSGPALAACPLPHHRLDRVPAWPDPPARWLAGWYLRSPAHAAAPPGRRELVQAPGEGFGPDGHDTTAMCLETLETLPAGPALDAGCGSGLLAQAWARLGRGLVVAVDLDPRALDQAARGLAAAGLAGRVDLRRAGVGALRPEDLAGRVLLANLPGTAHRQLLARIAGPPQAAVLSGLRPAEAGPVEDAYRALGLVPASRQERGGFVGMALVAA